MGAPVSIAVKESRITKEILGFYNYDHQAHLSHDEFFDRPPEVIQTEQLQHDDAVELIEKLSVIYIGEVSWMKAGLMGNTSKDNFIPEPISKLIELIPDKDFTPISDELIESVSKIFDMNNTSIYPLEASKEEVISFLNKNKGSEVFTITW